MDLTIVTKDSLLLDDQHYVRAVREMQKIAEFWCRYSDMFRRYPGIRELGFFGFLANELVCHICRYLDIPDLCQLQAAHRQIFGQVVWENCYQQRVLRNPQKILTVNAKPDQCNTLVTALHLLPEYLAVTPEWICKAYQSITQKRFGCRQYGAIIGIGEWSNQYSCQLKQGIFLHNYRKNPYRPSSIIAAFVATTEPKLRGMYFTVNAVTYTVDFRAKPTAFNIHCKTLWEFKGTLSGNGFRGWFVDTSSPSSLCIQLDCQDMNDLIEESPLNKIRMHINYCLARLKDYLVTNDYVEVIWRESLLH